MGPQNISLLDFEKLFPFSFSTDGKGVLLSAGPSLRKLIPELALGHNFSENFAFSRPQIESFEQTKNLLGEMIVLSGRPKDFKLMGQVLYSKEEKCFFFVVSLAVQDAQQLTDLKLNFNDFAIQDQVFDFLMLLQTQRRATREAEALNQKLTAAHKIAVEASEMKSQFLANMSHELRTPMNGVLGMAGILLETPLTDDQKDFVETIIKSGEGMLSLVNDILDLSKIEAGHIDLEQKPFDLRLLIDDVFQMMSPSALKRRNLLQMDIAANVPSIVVGDQNRLRQVLLNFLSNGVKFTQDGRVGLRLKAKPDENGPLDLQFEIFDTGIGMSPETLKKIFNPFVQGDSSMTKKFEGTGLGLSICKKIIAAMNGQIAVTSEIGQGSQFRFSISLTATNILETYKKSIQLIDV